MNRELLIIVIPALVAVVGALLRTFALPYLNSTVLPYIYSKTTEKQRDMLFKYVEIAVEVAEKTFLEKGQGKTKKEFVLNFIHKQFGWKIDEEILDEIIESAVKELNKYKEEKKELE